MRTHTHTHTHTYKLFEETAGEVEAQPQTKKRKRSSPGAVEVERVVVQGPCPSHRISSSAIPTDFTQSTACFRRAYVFFITAFTLLLLQRLAVEWNVEPE
jgi:hypothetical protein